MMGCLFVSCFNNHDRRVKKVLEIGEERLAKALDTRTIIRY